MIFLPVRLCGQQLELEKEIERDQLTRSDQPLVTLILRLSCELSIGIINLENISNATQFTHPWSNNHFLSSLYYNESRLQIVDIVIEKVNKKYECSILDRL